MSSVDSCPRPYAPWGTMGSSPRKRVANVRSAPKPVVVSMLDCERTSA